MRDNKIMLTVEEITDNFDTFASLCEELGDRSEAATKMVEHFGERLAMAPAAAAPKYAGAYHGGLIATNLQTLHNASQLVKTFDIDVKKSSLILCSLFHNIGVLGTKETDLYIEQENDWRRENLGEMFAFNQDISFMTIADRSTYLLQEFGINLEEDEYLAIRLANWDNRRYHWLEPPLAFVTYAASRLTSFGEKD